MKNRKIPLRTCVITKEKLPKKELWRIVRTPDKKVVVDETGKINGRGAYIKKDISILDKIKNSNILENRLECSIDESLYEEIKKVIEK